MTPATPASLRTWRETLCLTNHQAAKLACVSLRTWQRWEDPHGSGPPAYIHRIQRDIEREIATKNRPETDHG